MSTETIKTLRDLGPGDLVIADYSRYGAEQLAVERIFRVTETQIILRTERENAPPHDVRYRRDDGYSVGGDSFTRTKIKVPTPDLINRAKKQRLVSRLSGIRWKDQSLETLEAVALALKGNGSPERAATGGGV